MVNLSELTADQIDSVEERLALISENNDFSFGNSGFLNDLWNPSVGGELDKL